MERNMERNENISYHQNFIQCVIDNSESAKWKSAVLEWEIFDCEEDERRESSCLCGKENIRYLFTIRNYKNDNTLYPIGSSCIKKFNRNDLDDIVKVSEQLFNLFHAIENNSYITLSSEFFSRKLLKHLYDSGAFKPTKYNDYDPEHDYLFMLDMFNKRSRTERQENKITAIMLNSIKPFLRELLRDKIRDSN